PPGAPHASGAQLAQALEHRRSLVAQAKPVMAFLNEQIGDSGSLVLLADPQGMLLHALGDPRFADRAARVALRPGAIWSEQWRGTNAIGTALAEGHAVEVHGAEHYLERNGFLTCAAAPISDPQGALLGVLDISGDRRGYHRHTLGLVRSGARLIEHQLFQARHGGGLQMRLHAQAEGLGGVTEGLLALAEDGWVMGANRAALDLLALPCAVIGATRVDELFGLDWRRLRAGVPTALQHRGQTLWVRLDLGRQGRGWVAAAALPVDPLARLDSGDAAMQALIDRARRVLDKPIALLLLGESGVGKEVLARALHDSSARREQPFVALNCAALPEGLIEAELFGYRPGAFTGAGREGAPGRLREADGGTLFLDEIGDMPLPLQARLLRVLQDGEVQPLGGGRAVKVDFRLLCATHQPLAEAVRAGRFRADLYYRINGLTLTLPPLRARSDLPALVERLLAAEAPGRSLALEPELLRAFQAYAWPGNVRQLQHALRTACALLDDGERLIGPAHLPEDLAAELQPLTGGSGLPAGALREQGDALIRQVLQESGGNVSEAARRLGIGRNTLYRRLGQ
ncbi:MAG: sigma-54-dependent Fis family transcriptional regulator, partial [Burkholderiales bacterium]|nr:sigma-54-dependent Fis family transcriptional regulator [Burkholderiales bacterium]